VANRGGVVNLAMSLVGFLVFMVLLLAVVGSGVGAVELVIWLALLVLGIVLIGVRYRSASRP
jgi:hypothetical protein